MKKFFLFLSFVLLLSCSKEPLILLNPQVNVVLHDFDGYWYRVLVDINSNPESNYEGKFKLENIKLTCTGMVKAYTSTGKVVKISVDDDIMSHGYAVDGPPNDFKFSDDFSPSFTISVGGDNIISPSEIQLMIYGEFSLDNVKYSFSKYVDGL